MKRGFTLIEVLVTLAIVSILAGMMVPAVWKYWEGQEVQTTKERLSALKLAMVGDKNLMQNGIRTSYGFVGDNGELPFANSSSSASLSYLVNRPTSGYPRWNGPYLSGFDPAVYRKDAWGNSVVYSHCNSPDGRSLSGALRSGGPNGKLDAAYDSCDSIGTATFCLGDDICIPIDIKEVAPTHWIDCKVRYTNPVASKYANFKITFMDPDGERTESSRCKPAAGIFTNFTTVFPNATNPLNLPIGKITITSSLYDDPTCTAPPAPASSQLDYFVSDNLSRLIIGDLPQINTP